MAKEPVTPAIRQLRAEGVEYEGFVFDYKRFPGASGAATALGVDLHVTVKTIVLQTDEGDGVIVLINGDREVSTKKLARELDVKSTKPASQRDARRWTGYEFGGTSPFGTRQQLPILMHSEIPQMSQIYINAGSRGFLVRIRTDELLGVLGPRVEDLAG
jgi:Cys-tRNA(Pro) deacylase